MRQQARAAGLIGRMGGELAALGETGLGHLRPPLLPVLSAALGPGHTRPANLFFLCTRTPPQARLLMSAVAGLRNKFGLNRSVQLLRGSRSKDLQPWMVEAAVHVATGGKSRRMGRGAQGWSRSERGVVGSRATD